jgi:aryl-alcohol dehydrogenase-like predicted oxidoreductase
MAGHGDAVFMCLVFSSDSAVRPGVTQIFLVGRSLGQGFRRHKWWRNESQWLEAVSEGIAALRGFPGGHGESNAQLHARWCAQDQRSMYAYACPLNLG